MDAFDGSEIHKIAIVLAMKVGSAATGSEQRPGKRRNPHLGKDNLGLPERFSWIDLPIAANKIWK